MAKQARPTSPGRRFLITPGKEELTSVHPKTGKKVAVEKSLCVKKKRSGGRNNLGRMTCRHRGGGHKRLYRLVDFKRDKVDIPATVLAIQYDPNRSAHIALLAYADGEKRYILAPKGLKVGNKVQSGAKAPFQVGCALPLKSIPLGTVVHNIELRPGGGGVFVRSAGNSAQLAARNAGYATIKLPSKEVRLVSENCFATIGSLSNDEHSLKRDGKAGRRRWRGFRPSVRGVAMNPVDHPHGGGEGRRQHTISFNPWTTRKKGEKTRKVKKGKKMIVKARKK